MKRAIYIQKEVTQVSTIAALTSVFESIASLHIAQAKDKTISSTAFFRELYSLYSQLRVDRKPPKPAKAGKMALLIITSEGGLIGDIDEKIVDAMLQHPGREQADMYVVGMHGVALLARSGVKPIKSFSLPQNDSELSMAPLAALLSQYEQVSVYYQTYVSLMHQDVARIELFSAVRALEETAAQSQGPTISSRDYIFEPSLDKVITYMESTMRSIALSQVVLESKLAQYASRFNAMSNAKIKATDMRDDLRLQLNRSKRAVGDERTKETLSAMKVIKGRI